MTTLNVTIQLSEGDRAKLDAILGALERLAGSPIKAAEPAQVAPEPVKSEPAVPTPAPAEPAPAPVEKEAPAPAPKQTETAPEVTTAELQSKVVQLVSAGKKEATRAIVQEYAKSVGEIPADKRAEVLERLNALEG